MISVLSAIAYINKSVDMGDSQGTYKALSAPNACIADLDEENADKYQKSLEDAKSAKKEVGFIAWPRVYEGFFMLISTKHAKSYGQTKTSMK